MKTHHDLVAGAARGALVALLLASAAAACSDLPMDVVPPLPVTPEGGADAGDEDAASLAARRSLETAAVAQVSAPKLR